jgi:inward rectifier potassium channel
MLEIFIGMMSLALVTGVTFARFSLPRSRIVFAAIRSSARWMACRC